MGYPLADGTMSDEYKEGDKFVYETTQPLDIFPEWAVITLRRDDQSPFPSFMDESSGIVGYEYWSNLKAYKEEKNTNEDKEEKPFMIIHKMDYVVTKEFSLEELEKFEVLIRQCGYEGGEGVVDHIKSSWKHYGVNEGGYPLFYDKYFIREGGQDITEKFREYLNSLENTKEETEVEVTTDVYLNLKERLLALAEGKELEWLHDCEEDDWIHLESFQYDFGDILYDEEIKVRIKVVPWKDNFKLSFEKYCTSLELPSDITSNLFKFFKAGYDSAKENE